MLTKEDIEIITCKYCGKNYEHKIYRKNSNSHCPFCNRLNEKCKIGRVSHLKSPTLKECANPSCDDGLGRPFLFWALKSTDKFCCPECREAMERTKVVERGREWRKKNPIRAKELGKKFYEAHREELLQKQKEKRKENPEKFKEYGKKHYNKIKENKISKEKDYYKNEFWEKFKKDEKPISSKVDDVNE